MITVLLRGGEDATTSHVTQGSGAARLLGGDPSGFIHNASQANAAEVAFADLALQKTQNPDVKEFARRMSQDHQAANDHLRQVARMRSVAMNNSLDENHKKMMAFYQQLSGTEFDQQYMKDMLKGHLNVIALYEAAAYQPRPPEIKQYAQNTLPMLEQHLDHAVHTAQATGIDQQTIAAILTESPTAVGGTVEDTHEESGGVKTIQQK
jgi:putative membrane protein